MKLFDVTFIFEHAALEQKSKGNRGVHLILLKKKHIKTPCSVH